MTPPSDSMTICRDSIFRRNVSSFICSSTLLFLSFTIKKRTHIHGCAGRQSKEAYRSGTTPAGISTVSCDLLLRLQRASPSTSLDKNVIFHNSTNHVLNCQHNSEYIILKNVLHQNGIRRFLLISSQTSQLFSMPSEPLSGSGCPADVSFLLFDCSTCLEAT